MAIYRGHCTRWIFSVLLFVICTLHLTQGCELDFHMESSGLMLLAGDNGSVVCDATCFRTSGHDIETIWQDQYASEIDNSPASSRIFSVPYNLGAMNRIIFLNVSSADSGSYICTVLRDGNVVERKALRLIVFGDITGDIDFPPRETGPRRSDIIPEEDINRRPVRSVDTRIAKKRSTLDRRDRDLDHSPLSQVGNWQGQPEHDDVASLDSSKAIMDADVSIGMEADILGKGRIKDVYSTPREIPTAGSNSEIPFDKIFSYINGDYEGEFSDFGHSDLAKALIKLFTYNGQPFEQMHNVYNILTEVGFSDERRREIMTQLFSLIAYSELTASQEDHPDPFGGWDEGAVEWSGSDHKRWRREGSSGDAEQSTSSASPAQETTIPISTTSRSSAMRTTNTGTTSTTEPTTTTASPTTTEKSSTTTTPPKSTTMTTTKSSSSSGTNQGGEEGGEGKPDGSGANNKGNGKDKQSAKEDDASTNKPCPEVQKSAFGKYGVIAFAIAVAVAFLLLYAILMVIFMPRIMAKRNLNNKADAEKATYKKKSDDVEEAATLTLISDEPATSDTEPEVGKHDTTDLDKSMTPESDKAEEKPKDTSEESKANVSTFLLRQNSEKKDAEGGAKTDDKEKAEKDVKAEVSTSQSEQSSSLMDSLFPKTDQSSADTKASESQAGATKAENQSDATKTEKDETAARESSADFPPPPPAGDGNVNV